MPGTAFVDVLGKYEGKWESVTRETTWEEARARLNEYRENEPAGSFKLRTTTWDQIRAYARRKFNALRESQDCHNSHTATEALEATDKYFELGHGVEGFCDQSSGSHGVTYINMGDTYATTILFESDSERFTVGSWGDIVERHEEWYQ